MEQQNLNDIIWIICMSTPLIPWKTRCWKQIMWTDCATQITACPIKCSSKFVILTL